MFLTCCEKEIQVLLLEILRVYVFDIGESEPQHIERLEYYRQTG